MKQMASGDQKTYIVEDIEEEMAMLNECNGLNLANKSYIRGERRVTTVEEQQTWEDMEDDYENEQNIIDQFNHLKSQASPDDTGDALLRSFRDTFSDDKIESHEFKMNHEDTNEENVMDDNEEALVHTSSYETF